jgi:hypothetical protein
MPTFLSNSKRKLEEMTEIIFDQPIKKQKQSDEIDEFPLWTEAIERSQLATLPRDSFVIKFRNSITFPLDWKNMDNSWQFNMDQVPSYFLQFSSFGTEVSPVDIMMRVCEYFSENPQSQFSYHYTLMPNGRILPQVYAVVCRGSRHCFFSMRLYECTGPYAKLPPHLTDTTLRFTLVEFAKSSGDVELFCDLQNEVRARIEPHRKIQNLRHCGLRVPYLDFSDDENTDSVNETEYALSLLPRALSPYIKNQREGVQGLCTLKQSDLLYLLQTDEQKYLNSIIKIFHETLNSCDSRSQWAGVLFLQNIAAIPSDSNTSLVLNHLWNDILGDSQTSSVRHSVLEALTYEPSKHTHDFHILFRYAINQTLARIIVEFADKHMVNTNLPQNILAQCRDYVNR